MKYKSFDEARKDGWALVPNNSELAPLGTYYSYWIKDGKVVCEDDLIENWKMSESNKKLMVRTYENI